MENLTMWHYIVGYLIVGLLLTAYEDFKSKTGDFPFIIYIFGMFFEPIWYFQKLFKFPGKIFYYFKYRNINKKTP